MGLFDKFPSTKLNDINLDWILKVISKFKGGNAGQFLRKRTDANFDFYWSDSGGGGGGTSDYNELVNRPQINGVTLTGNKSASNLGLLNSTALTPYRTAAAQDTIDAAKQAKITAIGLLKGDGDGGVIAAMAGTDYLAPAALQSYRTAAAQDVIDAEQAAELGIVVDGNTTALGASEGQYIILRNSTISGCADGLYTAAQTIPANTAIDATYLSGPIARGGLNEITNSVRGTPTIGTGITTSYTWYRTYGKLVYVSINFKKASGVFQTNTIFLTGFPAPEDDVNMIAISGSDAGQNFKINTSGNMIVDGKTVSAELWYGGSCMYII